jgi:hypothetical protein
MYSFEIRYIDIDILHQFWILLCQTFKTRITWVAQKKIID